MVGPVLFHQSALVYVSWACCPSRSPLPLAHALRPERARGRRVAGRRRRDGDQRDALPLRARARRRRARRDRRRLLQPLRSRPGWTDGDSLVGGAGWIAIALVIFSFWRPELCLVGAYLFGGLSGRPALGAPGARVQDQAGVPERASVRHDDRRARARLVRARPPPLVGAPAALGIAVRARGALMEVVSPTQRSTRRCASRPSTRTRCRSRAAPT